MSKQKSYPKNKAKVPRDLKENQDRRLMSKHIDTLMKLDDTVIENEKLKSRVDVLEKELSSCAQLHSFAHEAKQKLDDLVKDYDDRISFLKVENSKKILDKEQDLQILISEIEKKWKRKQDNLMEKLVRAQKELIDLKNENLLLLQIVEVQKTNVNKLHEKNSLSQDREKEIVQLRNQLQIYSEEKSVYTKKNIELSTEVEKLEKHVFALSADLKNERDTSARLSNQNNLLLEIEQLTLNMDELSMKQIDHESAYENLQLINTKISTELEELKKKYKLLLMERDATKQSSSDLSLEVAHLKKKLSSPSILTTVSNECLLSTKKGIKVQRSLNKKHR